MVATFWAASDRDSKFTEQFCSILETDGKESSLKKNVLVRFRDWAKWVWSEGDGE